MFNLSVRIAVYYTGCTKKTEQIWNRSQFRKTASGIKFLIYIDSLYILLYFLFLALYFLKIALLSTNQNWEIFFMYIIRKGILFFGHPVCTVYIALPSETLQSSGKTTEPAIERHGFDFCWEFRSFRNIKRAWGTIFTHNVINGNSKITRST